jgi:hypothetical protein
MQLYFSLNIIGSDLTYYINICILELYLNWLILSYSVLTDSVMINDAKVTMANVPVTNGVIHVIDTVLLPK